ncbi:MAG TPA: hypothetical protein VL382_09650 [Terriglobales bacterium]|nr:hypothetical protein [Terriglobales bacterium]
MATIIALAFSVVCAAQEVGRLDLVDRDIKGWQHRNLQVGGGCGGGCDHCKRQPELRISFVSVGDQTIDPAGETEIELKIENVGKKDILLPFVPDPADIEPKSQDYRFDEMLVSVLVYYPGGKDFQAVLAAASFYARESADYLRLAPGQWASIRLKSSPLQRDEELVHLLQRKGELETRLGASLQVQAVQYHGGKNPHEDHDCMAKRVSVQEASQEGIFFRYTATRKESH